MSLVTTPTRALPACAHCASNRVMSITMTLTDGSVVDFVSCQRCERKSWTEQGSGLKLPEVLHKARKVSAKA